MTFSITHKELATHLASAIAINQPALPLYNTLSHNYRLSNYCLVLTVWFYIFVQFCEFCNSYNAVFCTYISLYYLTLEYKQYYHLFSNSMMICLMRSSIYSTNISPCNFVDAVISTVVLQWIFSFIPERKKWS